jgi:hypothetical protein
MNDSISRHVAPPKLERCVDRFRHPFARHVVVGGTEAAGDDPHTRARQPLAHLARDGFDVVGHGVALVDLDPSALHRLSDEREVGVAALAAQELGYRPRGLRRRGASYRMGYPSNHATASVHRPKHAHLFGAARVHGAVGGVHDGPGRRRNHRVPRRRT